MVKFRLLVVFACKEKSFATVCFLILLFTGVFEWIVKSCLCIFLLFLLQARVTNIGLINVMEDKNNKNINHMAYDHLNWQGV